MTEIAPYGTWKSPISAGDGVTRSDESNSSVVIRSPLTNRRCTCDVPGWRASTPAQMSRSTVMVVSSGLPIAFCRYHWLRAG